MNQTVLIICVLLALFWGIMAGWALCLWWTRRERREAPECFENDDGAAHFGYTHPTDY